MLKNEKIEKYMQQKRKADEVRTYLNFFTENYEEFEEFLADKEKFSFGNAMHKYQLLSVYIAKEHNVTWKDGNLFSSALVRNLYKLARRERQASKPKRQLSPELDTVLRVYRPGDDIE